MFGINFGRTKSAESTWTPSRRDRSKDLAIRSQTALELATETLNYDAQTVRNLGHIDLANAAFNAGAKQFNQQVSDTKNELREGHELQSLAAKFRYSALSGS